MSSDLARRCLKAYFERLLLYSPAHLPPANFYVDADLRVWYGAVPAEVAAPEHLLSAWALADLAVESFTGERCTLGLESVKRLAEAARIDDLEGRYAALRHDVTPLLPEFVRRVGGQLYDDAKRAADRIAR